MTIVALKLQVAYYDCNPDVGMGPSLESLLDKVLRRAGVSKTTINAERVLRLARPSTNRY